MKTSYQVEAYKFAAYSHADYPFLALGEEAGEVLGKVAKFGRKNHMAAFEAIIAASGTQHNDNEEAALQLFDDLVSELGDVQWQLAACCTELGISLEDVQAENLKKLAGRLLRGTIVGSGDKR